jgi:hypothetical protein
VLIPVASIGKERLLKIGNDVHLSQFRFIEFSRRASASALL